MIVKLSYKFLNIDFVNMFPNIKKTTKKIA